jgi:hypothetical protein
VSPPSAHPSFDALLDYWLHDGDDATIDAVDEHLMQCEDCGQVLDGIVALGEGVRGAFRAGAVLAMTSGAFVQRLLAQGRRVREYRLPHNGGVDCSVAPDDELLVCRLEAPLQGAQRLDVLIEWSLQPGVQHRLEDIPFDPQAAEVIYLPRIAQVKQLPAHTAWVRLMAVQADGMREVGRYTFRHAPWPGSQR